ncbi:MAG TPA: cytochrome P450 [Pseudonocardiaceae bacterium]|jgi:cytochrome P450
MTSVLPAPAKAIPIVPGRLPVLGHLMDFRKDTLGLLRRARAYGPVVQLFLGPMRAYVVNDAALARQILVGESRNFDKGRFWEKVSAVVGNGLANASGEHHLRQRRLMQPAFHRNRIAGYADTMAAHMQAQAESWQENTVLSIPDVMRDMALSIVSKTLFASGLGDAAATAIRTHFPAVQDGVMRRTMLPLGPLENLPTPGNRRFNEGMASIWSTAGEVVAQYRADGVDHGDLLSMLIAAVDEETGEQMTDEQIRDEVLTLALAGSDTTANAMAWLCYQLGQRPEVADRIAEEVRTVVGDRPVTFADLSKLDYTCRVVQEIFRMYTFWVLMRRALTDVNLDGYVLPKGSQVLLSLLSIHRDADAYRNPMSLDPDRWLPERVKDIPRTAIMPFGAGNRQCIADRFATTEVTIAAATIVPRWELRPIPGHVTTEVVRISVNPSSLPMRLVRRTK